MNATEQILQLLLRLPLQLILVLLPPTPPLLVFLQENNSAAASIRMVWQNWNVKEVHRWNTNIETLLSMVLARNLHHHHYHCHVHGRVYHRFGHYSFLTRQSSFSLHVWDRFGHWRFGHWPLQALTASGIILSFQGQAHFLHTLGTASLFIHIN